MVDTTDIRVIDDKLLCQIEEKSKKQGAILAPEHAKSGQNSTVCVVLATGPGRMLEGGDRNPMVVKVGDRVILDQRPVGFKIEGETYCVAETFNVIAILPPAVVLDAFQS